MAYKSPQSSYNSLSSSDLQIRKSSLLSTFFFLTGTEWNIRKEKLYLYWLKFRSGVFIEWEGKIILKTATKSHTPPVLTLFMFQNGLKILRHFISNCHFILFWGESFSARIRSNFHCDFFFCPTEINIVVRMSAQHPSGPTKQWFPVKCKYSGETVRAPVAANS